MAITSEVLELMQKEQEMDEAELAVHQFKLVNALSSEQVWEIRQAFNHFDKDGTGTIGTKELGSLFRALGQNLSDEELLQIIIRVDVDHDGVLDFPEFLHLMACILSKSKLEDSVEELFRVFDSSRDGKISVADLRQQLTSVYMVENVPDKDILELFSEHLGLPLAQHDLAVGDDVKASTAEDGTSQSSFFAYDNVDAASILNDSETQVRRFVTVEDFGRWLQAPSPLSSDTI